MTLVLWLCTALSDHVYEWVLTLVLWLCIALSGAVIAGIIIASLGGFILFVVLLIHYARRHRKYVRGRLLCWLKPVQLE